MVEVTRGIAVMAFLVVNTVVWCVPIYLLGALRPLMPTED